MKKYRWSRYNFLIEASNNIKYLYNSYTNLLLRLDEELYIEFKQLSENKKLNFDEISLSQEEIIYFIDNFIFVEDDENLVTIMQHQSMARLFNRENLVLTIAPTQTCNFGCVYCFEKWRSSGSMDDNTEESLIKYLKKQKEEYGLKTLHLNWYGGEPLLESQRILSLGNKIKELGLILLENEVITNGYFFTAEKIKILIEVGVTNIQITLDGPSHIHDKRRPLLNGKGTFDAIIKNLDDYYNSDFKEHFVIAIRVNVDKNNYKDYLKLYNWLNDRYNSDKLIVYPGWVHLDENNKSVSSCFSKNETTDIVLDMYRKYKIVSERMYPDDINMECLARSPYSMVIGWQGEIYKCFEDLGNKECIVGNINNPDIWENHDLIAKYTVGIDHYQDPQCRMCSYLPICHGGCPIRRLENKYFDKHNNCCTPFKGRIEEYVELYASR